MTCRFCPARIFRSNKLVACNRHRWFVLKERIKAARRPCAIDGCGVLTRTNNKTGVCASHWWDSEHGVAMMKAWRKRPENHAKELARKRTERSRESNRRSRVRIAAIKKAKKLATAKRCGTCAKVLLDRNATGFCGPHARPIYEERARVKARERRRPHTKFCGCGRWLKKANRNGLCGKCSGRRK